MKNSCAATEKLKSEIPANSFPVLFYLILLVVLFWALHPGLVCAKAEAQPPGIADSKHVLVVCSYGYGLHGYDKAIPAIRSVLEASGLNSSDFFVEFMDLLRSKDRDTRTHLADFYRQKYSGTEIDLIITVQLPALDFFLNEGRELWPDTPILSISIPHPLLSENPCRRVVLQSMSPDIEGTLNLALELFPKTKRVVYVTGVSEEEQRAKLLAENVFYRRRDRLEFESSNNMTIDEIVQLLKRLPEDTVVIFIGFHVDKSGRRIMPQDIAALLSKNACVPIFGSYDTVLGAGVIGGSMVSARELGARTGRLAVNILRGDLVPTEQATVFTGSGMPMFDWEQLKRWGVDKSRLPDESIIVNLPESPWYEYGWIIVISLIILTAQSLLIIGLLIHKRRRRTAEESLKKAEEKYRNIFEGALEGIFETSPEGKPLTCNPRLAKMLGYDSPEDVLSSISDLGHQAWIDPNQRLEYILLLEKQDFVLNHECEMYRKDMSKIWVSLSSRRVCGPDGKTLHYSGFIQDISERKRIKNALAESRAQIVAVVDSTNDFIWSVDPLEFGVLTWNRAFGDYFLKGRGIGLRVGMTPEELVPPEFVPLWKGMFERALQEGHFVTEYTVVAGTIVLLLSFNLLRRNEEVFGISIFGKDITARKKVEEELLKSEERYRALVETSADWVWEVDAEAKYTYTDPKVEKILGYTPDEVLGRTPLDFMSAEEARRVGPIFAEISASRRQFSSLINVNLHRDGREVVLETSGIPIYGPGGDLLGYRGMDRNVTERIVTEKALRESEERLRLTLEANSEGVWDWDIPSGKAFFSKSYSGMLGYEPEEFPKDYAGWKELIHPEDFPRIDQAHTAHIQERQEFCVEFRMRKKTGDWCWIRSRGTVIERDSEDRAIRMVGTHWDITDIKLAEKALRASDEVNRATFEQAAVGIAHVGINGHWLRVNDRLCAIVGYPREELMQLTFQDISHPEDLEKDLDYVRRMLSGEINTYSMEKRYLRKDRSQVWANLTVSLVRTDTGAHQHFIAVLEDITERKRTDAELRRYRDHLEEMIEERTAELKIAKEQAEAADHVKSVFLATMSHELRTPLNLIIGFAGILEQELTGPLNNEQKRQLGLVRESGSHLLNLVNDVLDISKIEAGQLEVSEDPFNLRALIQRVAQSVKPMAEEKRIGFELEIAPDVDLISSDRRRVEQILLNLLGNAIKFTHEGMVRVTCLLHGREVSVEINDSGIGIKKEDMDKLFRPFQQIQSDETERIEGTGLGLSICKKLLDILGGKIVVASEWGKGSTFSFTLPVERSRNETQDACVENNE
ncbi:MAG: PAS domain S-box protein [Syntrophobacteraceae bacterium]